MADITKWAEVMPLAAKMVLPNGAEVILYKSMISGGTWTVLAKWNQQWVCWKVDSNGNAYWGHYFKLNQLDEAVEFYEGRR